MPTVGSQLLTSSCYVNIRSVSGSAIPLQHQCNIFSLSSSPDRVSTNISCNGLLPLVQNKAHLTRRKKTLKNANNVKKKDEQ